MKEILIKESNLERIQTELDKVQKQCKVRTISVKDLLKAVEKIDIHLYQRCGLSKRAIQDLEVEVNFYNRESFPKAYKYPPQGTIANLIFKHGTWRLKQVSRVITGRSANRVFKFNFTKEQEAQIAFNLSCAGWFD